MVDRLIRRQEVEKLTGLSRSTIYRLRKLGKFPEQVRVGSRAVRWWLSEILDWIKSRPRGTDSDDGTDSDQGN